MPTQQVSDERVERRSEAPSVLLVDDHAPIRAALRELLGDAGLEVIGEAADGQQGVTLAHRLNPDVVIMDVSMPVLDGLEATRRLTRVAPHIRVIIFTAYAGQELTDAALAAGARTVVWKGPIQELVRAVFAVAE